MEDVVLKHFKVTGVSRAVRVEQDIRTLDGAIVETTTSHQYVHGKLNVCDGRFLYEINVVALPESGVINKLIEEAFHGVRL
jgi:hypothetical protein